MDIELYDTTLRDGAQQDDISLSVEDKLKITRRLDELGVSYIEGGTPGSNPKDEDYFQQVKSLTLSNARVAAFGLNAPGKGRTRRRTPASRLSWRLARPPLPWWERAPTSTCGKCWGRLWRRTWL